MYSSLANNLTICALQLSRVYRFGGDSLDRFDNGGDGLRPGAGLGLIPLADEISRKPLAGGNRSGCAAMFPPPLSPAAHGTRSNKSHTFDKKRNVSNATGYIVGGDPEHA